jgi:hypothetical protein
VTEAEAHAELSAYTLGHGSRAFIHQHVVDAWGAQHAAPDGKPIRLAFSLVGLYLKIEKGFSGRQVQDVHRRLADRKQPWPAFAIPSQPGSMTTVDVMKAAEGPDRDAAIDAWCDSVWKAFSSNRDLVVDLLRRNQII